MEELLSLKWNNHRSTFLHILSVLRDKQLYTDATLACDGKFYSVHRLVLSTCSDYFSSMFDRTSTCKNPIIVLKDIKCEDLEALLDYMYLGEVNVRQADLASLIKSAECLRVKGLAVPDDEPPPKRGKSDTSNVRRTDGSGSPPSKRKRREDGQDRGSSRPKSPQNQTRLSPPAQDPLNSNEVSRNNDASLAPINEIIVKVEKDDNGNDGVGDSFEISDTAFKEEVDDDHIEELSNDLPEFLQSNDDSYSQSYPGPSYQPDLQNWQGDPALAGNDFSGMGFPTQSQDGTQNTSGIVITNVSNGSSTRRGFNSTTLHPSPGVSEPPFINDVIIPELLSLSTADADDCKTICSVCGKGFRGIRWKRNLQRHMMLHNNDRPYACEHCDYRSNQKGNLNCHIVSQHPHLSDPLACD